jgi:hypothetical protein
MTLDEVRDQIRAGEWHMLCNNGSSSGGLWLLRQDERLWGKQPPIAGYVYGLVIERRLAGQSIGAGFLRWAGFEVTAAARSVLRLDCVETNSALRRYDERHAFTRRSRRWTSRPATSTCVSGCGLPPPCG